MKYIVQTGTISHRLFKCQYTVRCPFCGVHHIEHRPGQILVRDAWPPQNPENENVTVPIIEHTNEYIAGKTARQYFRPVRRMRRCEEG